MISVLRTVSRLSSQECCHTGYAPEHVYIIMPAIFDSIIFYATSILVTRVKVDA